MLQAESAALAFERPLSQLKADSNLRAGVDAKNAMSIRSAAGR